MPIGLTIVEVVLGAIIAIATTIYLENLRKPKLELRIALHKDVPYSSRYPAAEARFLYLELINKPMPWWARWMSRDVAMQCHGTINFCDYDGQNIFDRAMPIRWSRSPEPVPMRGVVDGKQIEIFDPALLNLVRRVDVYPGQPEPLDVAARFDGDDECYGWSNESYFSDPPWRNPRWKLPSGCYLVHVSIDWAGEKCTGTFRLMNDGTRQEFQLEPALVGDSVRD